MFFKIEKANYELTDGPCTSVSLTIFLQSGFLNVPDGEHAGEPEIMPMLLVSAQDHEDQALEQLAMRVDAARQAMIIALGRGHDNVAKCTELYENLKLQAKTLADERIGNMMSVGTQPPA